ncbi:MAG: Holliday junction resolvase RuvX [Rickettsiales bacterium]|nr:Holliday junction resolvase RuvX [Rickettsiales bacterium]
MLIRNIKEFLKLTFKRKLICLDIGKKRTGIAISDQNHKISLPLKVIKKDMEFYAKILEILKEFSIGGIIVGIPLNSDEKINKMSQTIDDITKNINQFLLENNVDLPIFFWDESYTSLEAEHLTKNFFKSSKDQKKHIDKFAAKIILDDFLREYLNLNEKENN